VGGAARRREIWRPPAALWSRRPGIGVGGATRLIPEGADVAVDGVAGIVRWSAS